MARPRKLANPKQLEAEAECWALFLHALRDGESGTVYASEWDLWETLPGTRKRVRHGRVVGARIIALHEEITEEAIQALEKSSKGRLRVERPVYPDPAAWAQLKRADAASTIRQVASRIREWGARLRDRPSFEGQTTIENPRSDHFSFALTQHADALARAKRLPNYPGDPSSKDDKRLIFFAKVMAGLTLGLAPLTATKRLGHWRPLFLMRSLDEGKRQLAKQHPLNLKIQIREKKK